MGRDGDDGGVKTLKLQGERRCVRVKVVPRFIPLGGSVDCYKVVDDGDCVDVVIEGKMADLPTLTRRTHINHYIWIASPGFKTEKKIEDGTLIVHTPAIKSSFPKKEIDFMSSYQVAKKIQSDIINSTCLELGKLGCVLDPQGFIEMLKKEDEDEASAAAGNKGKEKEAKKRKGKEMLNLDEAAAEGKEEEEEEEEEEDPSNNEGEETKKKRKHRSEEDEAEAKKEKR